MDSSDYPQFQQPAIERFVAVEDAEPVEWPWVRRSGGIWQVVDLARGVAIRRGMPHRRAVEHARFAHRYAPPILGHNVDGRPIGLSGGYVFEVWAWNQCARWNDGLSGSAWVLEALCESRQNAALVGTALLERTLRRSDGPTAVEVWAPTSPRSPGAWECLDRDELDPTGREILERPGGRRTDAEPGASMPWHLVSPNGNVAGVHVAPGAASDIPA